jgi:hypothetical protein
MPECTLQIVEDEQGKGRNKTNYETMCDVASLARSRPRGRVSGPGPIPPKALSRALATCVSHTRLRGPPHSEAAPHFMCRRHRKNTIDSIRSIHQGYPTDDASIRSPCPLNPNGTKPIIGLRVPRPLCQIFLWNRQANLRVIEATGCTV